MRGLGERDELSVVELEELGEVDGDVVEVRGDERDEDELPPEPAREALVVEHGLVRDAEALGAEDAHERSPELAVADRGDHRLHAGGVPHRGGGSSDAPTRRSRPEHRHDERGHEEDRGGDRGGATPVPP